MRIGALPNVIMETYKKTSFNPTLKNDIPVASDAVEISSSDIFSEVLSAARDLSDERMDKVLSCKQQISSGNYVVNSSELAEKMLCGVVRPTV